MCARVSAHARRERVQGKVRRDRGRGLVPSVPPRDATGAGYGPRASGSDASPSRSPPPRPHVSPPAAPSKASAPRMDYQLSPLLPLLSPPPLPPTPPPPSSTRHRRRDDNHGLDHPPPLTLPRAAASPAQGLRPPAASALVALALGGVPSPARRAGGALGRGGR